MHNVIAAERFIRNRIKYSADRCYVAQVSPSLINSLWRRINENEFNGFGYEVDCGHIDINILRAAFLREMSYNPLRFEKVTLDAPGQYEPVTAEIVNAIHRVLKFFSKTWPNGIQHKIVIFDKTDNKYMFLLLMRDCFKKIARQNLVDFKKVAYRDEMIARFANATDILIPADIRIVLQQRNAASAVKRDRRRTDREYASAKKLAVDELAQRMHDIQTQMGLHVRHDTKYYNELQAEYEELMSQWRNLTAQCESVAPKKRMTKNKARAQMPVRSHVGPEKITMVEDDTDVSDSAEREMELLRSLTPEHMADEVFQDYVQQMVGLNLHKYNQNQH